MPLKVTSTPHLNVVTLAIPKWRTFKLLRWVKRSPLITFEMIGGFGRTPITPKWRTCKLLRWVHLLNRLADLDEILFVGDDIEGDFDVIFSNLIASTIP
jgi:hypothetical protein